MNARQLAEKLMEHPDADVMVIDPDDTSDFDYIGEIAYYGESDRFHLLSSDFAADQLMRKFPEVVSRVVGSSGQQYDEVDSTPSELMHVEKEPAGLWRYDPATPEGKYLVKRRDGSIVEWPSFVLGAKDPAAPYGLEAYAKEAFAQGCNSRYCDDVLRLAFEFREYRRAYGVGDPDRGRHRKDDPATIAEMRKGNSA
jgi:hypothetical protein